jgi:hypothetical protein
MARRIFVALLGVTAALDTLILIVRVADIFRFGHQLYIYAEGPVLYSIWKLRNGYPLYEWPTRPSFALTLYNFLFYETYAAIFTALGVSNQGMLMAGRFVTLAFTAAGAAAQYVAGREFTPRSFRLPLALLAVITWFGCLFPGIWYTSIRPDMGGVACATIAVAILLPALRTNRRWPLAAAGVAFLLGWGFKQTEIALFVATCAYLLVWRRSIAAFALLAAPFVIGIAIALAVGGSVYRANILTAPSINPWIPYQALYWYRSLALTDLLIWGMTIYALVVLVRPGSVHGPLRSPAGVPERSLALFGADLTYPALAVIVTFAIGAPLVAKIGSGRHHLLELNVAASLTCAAVLGSWWEHPKPRHAWTAGTLMLVPMIAYALVLVADRPTPLATVLTLKADGTTLHQMTARDIAVRERLDAVVARMPKPVFVEDDVFALPWHSTDDRYPAFVLDYVFYGRAYTLGLVGGGVEGLFASHYFASAVLTDASPCLTPALNAGYHLTTIAWDQPGTERLRLLVRTP